MNAPKRDAPRPARIDGASAKPQTHPTSAPDGVKPLPTTFKSGGFRFRQLMRQGHIALFEKRKRPDGAVSFEVVKIRRLPARTVFGTEYPPSEAMPPSERWGVEGWTYCDVDSAREKFQALAEAQDKPALCTHPPVKRVGLVE